jgi:hypothetical protein
MFGKILHVSHISQSCWQTTEFVDTNQAKEVCDEQSPPTNAERRRYVA